MSPPCSRGTCGCSAQHESEVAETLARAVWAGLTLAQREALLEAAERDGAWHMTMETQTRIVQSLVELGLAKHLRRRLTAAGVLVRGTGAP